MSGGSPEPAACGTASTAKKPTQTSAELVTTKVSQAPPTPTVCLMCSIKCSRASSTVEMTVRSRKTTSATRNPVSPIAITCATSTEPELLEAKTPRAPLMACRTLSGARKFMLFGADACGSSLGRSRVADAMVLLGSTAHGSATASWRNSLTSTSRG